MIVIGINRIMYDFDCKIMYEGVQQIEAATIE